MPGRVAAEGFEIKRTPDVRGRYETYMRITSDRYSPTVHRSRKRSLAEMLIVDTRNQ